MNKLNFFISLNILNILLFAFICYCTSADVLVIFSQGIWDAPNELIYLGLECYFIYAISKLYLPKLIVSIAKRYKNLFFGKLKRFLLTIKKEKLKVLAIGFLYDLIFLSSFSYHIYNSIVLEMCLFLYTIVFVGGLLLFYLTLFHELKKLDFDE